MAFSIGTQPRCSLRLAVAGAVLLSALTATTASAASPTPMEVSAPDRPRLGAAASATPGSWTGASTRPRTPIPGFLLERGRYTKFDAPDAVQQTNPFGINNRGVIVGKYTTADGVDHGFRRDALGRFTTIDFPGAAATQLNKVNDRGQIVGRLATAPGGSFFRGLLVDGGRLVRIDVPGAMYTQPLGINNRGQVVGEYQTPDGTTHGFLWQRGRFTTIDKPGAPATSLVDINDRGQILGATADPADPAGLASLRPFVLDQGRFVTFRAPDAPLTFPYDLNNRGQIVGYTAAPTATDPLAGARGFLLARGARGPFTPIDVPGAPRSVAYGLNDAGAIVGQYENTAATSSPQPAAAMPMGVATALTAATAAASPPAPMQVQAAGPAQQGADPDRRAGTPPPGFLLERGRFKPVTLPPGLEDLTLRGIAPIDLNDRSQIVGTYEEPIGGAARGFLLQRGRFTMINPPGAKGTQTQGINNRGQIVGIALNPEDLPSPPSTDTAPMGRMA